MSGRSHTIHSRLVLLIIACVIPAALMILALISHNSERERARLVRDSISTARALTSAVDRDLTGVQSALFVLAASPYLSSNDLLAFHGQAKEVLGRIQQECDNHPAGRTKITRLLYDCRNLCRIPPRMRWHMRHGPGSHARRSGSAKFETMLAGKKIWNQTVTAPNVN